MRRRVNARAQVTPAARFTATVTGAFYAVHHAPVPHPSPLLDALVAAIIEGHAVAVYTLARHRLHERKRHAAPAPSLARAPWHGDLHSEWEPTPERPDALARLMAHGFDPGRRLPPE